MINHRFQMGGSPTSLADLAHELRARGWNITIAGGEGGPVANRLEKEGFNCWIIPKEGFCGWKTILGYIQLIRKEGVCLVHLNTLTSYFKYPAMAARICGVPAVWWAREELQAKRCRRLFPWIKFLSSALVVVSSEQENFAVQSTILKSHPVHVILKGLDAAALHKKAEQSVNRKIPQTRPWILFIGRLEERKSPHVILEAMHMLDKKGMLLDLVIIGDLLEGDEDYKKMFRQLLTRLGLVDRVHVMGVLDNPHPYFKLSSLMVLPTKWDCAPRVVMEAMIHSCPVVCTDIPGNHDLITEGVTGTMFVPGDSSACASAIEKVLNDDKMRMELTHNARRHMETQFSLPATVDKIEALYAKV
ncbi:MAG: glycosyltransferase family 4 protein [Candidatus Methylacidiphilales bacterium]|nr:glycosyltransferase family 4 protein [Candidatus Methylacidiphilales bacterium]